MKDLNGKTVGVVRVFRDVTEGTGSNRSQKASKLESLGVLAGG
jgi:hypothetical protein